MPAAFLRQGRRYEAAIALGLLQSLASNDVIANLFAGSGFSDVAVTGAGASRSATGLWSFADATLRLPAEVTSVRELLGKA